MAFGPTCPECGAALPPNAPQGLCPRCLARMALSPDAAEQPALPGIETTSPQATKPTAPTPPPRIRYFGDYELLEEIARGGMGVVYRARQVSLNRVVAVKLLLFGRFASDEFVRRFRTEAEAAASLQHPGIVSIHEIGEHEGQHYFSMDLVEGRSLAETLRDGPMMSMQAVLCLRAVTEAIHFAHQRGILHRDIKPGNILLDGNGAPHVTDFGLARLLEQSSNITQTESVLGTPSYMAPEQAGGQPKHLTTSADVYGLGAVFYHLLTGRPPFAAATATETLRQVLEKEVELPRVVDRRLDRDLERICLKCLEKDPQRRYGSAEALAEDLNRWLRHEPVVAAAPSATYRLKKFVRRHRAGVAAAAAMVVLLAAGVVVSTWQAARARRAEKTALTQAHKSEQVTRFLQQMLEGAGPSVANGRDPTLLLEILDKTAARIAVDFKAEPEVEADVRSFLGGVYFDLSKYADAETMFRKVLDLRKQLHGNEHVEVADALNNLGMAIQASGRMGEALTLLTNALAMQRKCGGVDRPETAMILHNLAGALCCEGRFPQAEPFAREALAIERRVRGETHPDVVKLLNTLAEVLEYQGKLDQAEALHRDAIAAHRRLSGTDNADTSLLITSLADNLHRQQRFADAVALLRDGLAHVPPPSAERPWQELPQLGVLLHHLAELLSELEGFEEAQTLAREAAAVYQRHPEWSPLERQHAFHVLAALAEPSELPQVEAQMREALALVRKGLSDTSPFVADMVRDLNNVLRRQGKTNLVELGREKAASPMR